MLNSRVNFLVKIPIRCWDINKTRQGITFICRTLYVEQYTTVKYLIFENGNCIKIRIKIFEVK